MHSTALHCTALQCCAVQCSALKLHAMQITTLYCTALQCPVMPYIVLNCTELNYTTMHCTHCSAVKWTIFLVLHAQLQSTPYCNSTFWGVELPQLPWEGSNSHLSHHMWAAALVPNSTHTLHSKQALDKTLERLQLLNLGGGQLQRNIARSINIIVLVMLYHCLVPFNELGNWILTSHIHCNAVLCSSSPQINSVQGSLLYPY